MSPLSSSKGMFYMENKLDAKKNDKATTSMECIAFEELDTTIKIK